MKKIALSLVLIFLSCIAYAAVEDEIVRLEKSDKVVKAPLSFQVVGKAQAAPEVAVIHFVIIGDGDTLTAAQEKMKQTEEAVSAALVKQGVKSTDIELSEFTVVPIMPGGQAGLKPVGYRVQREYKICLPVTEKSLDKVMQVADAALSQGARPMTVPSSSYDRYDPPSPSLLEFAVKDSKPLIKQAMDNGLAQAREMAVQAAEKMGYTAAAVKLVGVRASDNQMGPECFGMDDSGPINSSSWKPIEVDIAIEAAFDVK